MNNLVLSIFPGIDLLGRAFEEEGFCVVRGPDVLWGGDIRNFHPLAGVFDGIIGGPPCQEFVTNLTAMVKSQGKKSKFGNLIPEFERVITEAQPVWFIMENVRRAPLPSVKGYIIDSRLFNNRWTGAKQNRLRRITFGTKDGRHLLLDEVIFHNPEKKSTVLAADTGPRRWDGKRINYSLAEAMELQGVPPDFFTQSPFLASAKRELIGNGVPMYMGRAIAKAVFDTLKERRR